MKTYQKGPLTPYCQATLEDWRSVAAQVHCDTITDAIKPVFTERPAVLKCSLVIIDFPDTLSLIKTINDVRTATKKPKPRTMAQPTAIGRGGFPPKKESIPAYS